MTFPSKDTNQKELKAKVWERWVDILAYQYYLLARPARRKPNQWSFATQCKKQRKLNKEHYKRGYQISTEYRKKLFYLINAQEMLIKATYQDVRMNRNDIWAKMRKARTHTQLELKLYLWVMSSYRKQHIQKSYN